MKRLILLVSALPVLPAYAASSSGGPFGWLMDPTTNTAFAAMVIFLLIVWRLGAFKAIFGSLDNRADAIRKELDEAKQLREEAAKALASAERQQKEAEAHAGEMIAQAKADSDAMMKEARKELEERLKRREAAAEERIARAEADASRAVRMAAADAATEAAKALMAGEKDYFDTAATEIEKALN